MDHPPGPPDTPRLTVDTVLEMPDGSIVLIERASPPSGWALPGGFVDVGEPVEAAALRELREETGAIAVLTHLMGVYSNPARDKRGHNVSAVYVARPAEPDAPLEAGSDACGAQFFVPHEIPWAALAFDHAQIVEDYFRNWRHVPPTLGPRPPAELSEDETHALLDRAKAALSDCRRGVLPSETRDAPARLRRREGLFIELSDGSGRAACGGRVEPDEPLYELLPGLVAAAASQFGLSQIRSADTIALKIWRVGPLYPIAHPAALRAGRDGAVVRHKNGSAVLLPSVAKEQGLDARDFVAALMQKAGLGAQAWTRPEHALFAFATESHSLTLGEDTSC